MLQQILLVHFQAIRNNEDLGEDDITDVKIINGELYNAGGVQAAVKREKGVTNNAGGVQAALKKLTALNRIQHLRFLTGYDLHDF